MLPPLSRVGATGKRKAIVSPGPRLSIHTGPNRDSSPPAPFTSQHATVETPATLSHIDTQIEGHNSRPQLDGISGVHQVERTSNVESLRERPTPQDIFTGYNHPVDIGIGYTQDVYTSPVTTINSMPPLLPKRLRPSLVAPSTNSIDKLKPKSMSRLREGALVATICLAHFLTLAGLSQSIAPLPLIEFSFTSPAHDASPSWYSAAYSLTVGAFILPSGRLGDVYGPRRLFVIGWLWLAVSSLCAGLYPRMPGTGDQRADGQGGEIFFCFCRALQGIGPALLMPNGLSILGQTYEDGDRKNMASALFGASAPLGLVVGSVMSALLAQKTDWFWAYRALAMASAIMAVISLAAVPYLPGTVASTATKDDVDTAVSEGKGKVPFWKQLDIPGTILGVTGLILINVALNQAPHVGWSTPYTYFLLILGIIILSFFFFIEAIPSVTSHPLIPHGILSLDTCSVLACIACGWGTFGIWIYYLWEFLAKLRGLSPLLAAAQFSPAAASGLLAAVSTGFLLSKTTPQVIMVLSMCAFFVGTTLISTTPVGQIYWAQAFVSIVVMPCGMDMSFRSATLLLSSKVGYENRGVAMSLVNTVINYSISVGLGLAGTVQTLIDKDGTQLLKGYRAAWYFGLGLGGTGIAIALICLAVGERKANSGLRGRGKDDLVDPRVEP